MNGGTSTISAHLAPPGLLRLRQGIYRLFGALFLYPDETRLANLHAAAEQLLQTGDSWASVPFSEHLGRLLALLASLDTESETEIEGEYVRLFLAKPAAPPYESYYVDPEGQARAWIVNQLEREYADAGLAISPSLMDLPDHIAVELEFMSFLCGEEAEVRETGLTGCSDQIRQRQSAFLGHHLGRWFPQFSRRVIETSPEGFYGTLVQTTFAFLRHELDLLGLRSGHSGAQ